MGLRVRALTGLLLQMLGDCAGGGRPGKLIGCRGQPSEGERALVLESFRPGFEFRFYLLLTLVGISIAFHFWALVCIFKTRAVELYQWFSTFTGHCNHLGKFLNYTDAWALCPEILIHLVWSGTKSSIVLKISPCDSNM